MAHFNPLTTSVPHHKETSQLIFIAIQLTSFYTMGNTGRPWVKLVTSYLKTTINLFEINFLFI